MNDSHADPIIIKQTVNAPLEAVWAAISEPGEMKRWYFDLPDFCAEIGYKFDFYEPGEQKKWHHLCEILAVERERKLKYSWRYDGHAGISFVTFDLAVNGAKTEVTLIHEGIESFPEDVPELARENFVIGWKSIINESLPKYFELRGSL